MNNIKRIIQSNPFLFNLWFYLYRRKRGVSINYFDKNTKFLLDGYPRSGNTFASSLVKNTIGSECFVHHFHFVAPLKIALKRKIPAFILVRDPKEAITSYYLKSFALKHKEIPKEVDKELLAELTTHYFIFYEYVQEKRDELEIINFQNLINNPKDFLDSINKKVFNNKLDLNKNIIEKAISSYRGATDTYGSSKPNPQKEKLKASLKDELFKIPQYKKAETIYNNFK